MVTIPHIYSTLIVLSVGITPKHHPNNCRPTEHLNCISALHMIKSDNNKHIIFFLTKMNLSDCTKDIFYCIAIHLQPKQVTTLMICNKKIYNRLSSEQFWCHKLSYDFSLYCVPPLDLTHREWYELVFIMTTVTDAHVLDDLTHVACFKQKHTKVAVLLIAAAYHRHVEIMDLLSDIDPDMEFNQLPLTPENFILLPPIVEYIKRR